MASIPVQAISDEGFEPETETEKRIWRFLRYLFTKGGIEHNQLVIEDNAVKLSDILEIEQVKNAKVPLTEEDFETAILLNESRKIENRRPFTCVDNKGDIAVRYCPELDLVKEDETLQKVNTSDLRVKTKKKNKNKSRKGRHDSESHAGSIVEQHDFREQTHVRAPPSVHLDRKYCDQLGSPTSPVQTRGAYNTPNNWEMMSPQMHGSGQRGGNTDVRLSKSLSFTLRHGAEKLGLAMQAGGFIFLDDLLRHDRFKCYTVEDIERVTANNDKKRFFIDYTDVKPKIRANQGHTLQVDVELTEITDASAYPNVIHGTYWNAWDTIKREGLSRMKRNHIHFAPGEPGNSGVISGMRKTCEVIISVDLGGALRDGIKFFVSANGVILTSGDENGLLKPCYFKAAYSRSPKQLLSL